MKKLEEHEEHLRQAVNSEREHLQELTAQAEEERDKIHKDYIDCKQKLSEADLDLK
jgi:vacuolar-type H+-ATPase subunit H